MPFSRRHAKKDLNSNLVVVIDHVISSKGLYHDCHQDTVMKTKTVELLKQSLHIPFIMRKVPARSWIGFFRCHSGFVQVMENPEVKKFTNLTFQAWKVMEFLKLLVLESHGKFQKYFASISYCECQSKNNNVGQRRVIKQRE